MPFLPPEALADEASIALVAARAIALAKGGDTRGALNLALQARRQAQGLDIESGELEALSAAAIVHLIRGDAIAAVAAAMDARDLALRAADPALHGHVVVSLCASAFNLGVVEDVLSPLHLCAEGAAAGGAAMAAVEIRARVALGVVLGDRGRFDAARQQFTRALHLSRLHDSPSGPARITANVANLSRKRALADLAAGFEARALHECDEGLREARRAGEFAAREGNVAVEIDALAIGGCLRDRRGARPRALASLRSAAERGRAWRCHAAIVPVLCDTGRLAALAGELGQARAAYAEALEIAGGLRPSRKIAQACAGLADVEARLGDPVAAGRWRDRAAAESAEFEVASLQTRRLLREFFAE